jgi:hypothetical protein
MNKKQILDSIKNFKNEKSLFEIKYNTNEITDEATIMYVCNKNGTKVHSVNDSAARIKTTDRTFKKVLKGLFLDDSDISKYRVKKSLIHDSSFMLLDREISSKTVYNELCDISSKEEVDRLISEGKIDLSIYDL